MILSELEERTPMLYIASCEDGGAVPYITGPVGWGKTDTVKQFPFKMQRVDPSGNYCIVILNGATLNYGTMGGYLQFGADYKGKPTSRFSYPWWWFETWAIVNGVLVKTGKGIDEYDGGIIFIDEADKMDQDVRKTAGAAALDKNWFSHGLPPGFAVWFAGNLMNMRSGSHKDFDHLINRRREIPIRKDTESWVEWARRNKKLPEIISFGETYPLILFSDKPEVQGPWCTPRSLNQADIHLQAVMQVYQMDKIPVDPLVEEELAGGIGSGSAAQLITHIRMGQELPSIEDVVKDPLRCPVPTKVDGKRLMAYRVAAKTKEKNSKQVLAYMSRFEKEFQIIFVRLAMNTTFDLLFDKNFSVWFEQPENAALVAIVDAYKAKGK
jgi:hypothetical protein